MSKQAPPPQVAGAPTVRRVAAERTEPLAILRTSRRTVMVNFKLAEARKAAIAANRLIDIDPLDLENRSPKRRAAA